ncbi:MAG: VWA domain-containing protein [Muribaculaceae bacterium]|nr:VWA domain-containing protein [Muribaculaceae bacterium]
MNTTVFNLIILDESGSMSGLTEQTISGCNETINVARAGAEKNAETMRSLMSVYAFQDGGPVRSRYILKNEDAAKARHITHEDYSPCGNTPLLDAVGSTLTELEAVAASHEDATGVITIITDGYENSSHRYSWADVARLIARFKEKGWIVNLIGANIDVNEMAERMNIDNRMAFSANKGDTRRMWSDYNRNLSDEMECYANESRMCDMSVEDRKEMRKARSKSFFRR